MISSHVCFRWSASWTRNNVHSKFLGKSFLWKELLRANAQVFVQHETRMIPCCSCSFGRNVERKAMIASRRIEGGREENVAWLSSNEPTRSMRKKRRLRWTRDACDPNLPLEQEREDPRFPFIRCSPPNSMRLPLVSRAPGSRPVGLGSGVRSARACPACAKTGLDLSSSYICLLL